VWMFCTWTSAIDREVEFGFGVVVFHPFFGQTRRAVAVAPVLISIVLDPSGPGVAVRAETLDSVAEEFWGVLEFDVGGQHDPALLGEGDAGLRQAHPRVFGDSGVDDGRAKMPAVAIDEVSGRALVALAPQQVGRNDTVDVLLQHAPRMRAEMVQGPLHLEQQALTRQRVPRRRAPLGPVDHVLCLAGNLRRAP